MATAANCSQTVIFKLRFCANSTQALEMNEFTLNPERRAGVGKVGPFNPTLPDR
ncbi:hypothetical protein K6301_24230 (plasmid) [Shinella oryzae]|nr:hypothetical protein [Shinella oryzae]UPA27009.1 hypothetical protein K6301_24230 [Shinella oryzae]